MLRSSVLGDPKFLDLWTSVPRMQLWFKGVPQLLEIGREPIKIVCDLEHCVSFSKELASVICCF